MSSALVVQVKFFASLREATGTAACACDFPATTRSTVTIDDLLDQLCGRFGAEAVVALKADNVRIAVNQSLVASHQQQVRDGDEVAFLPPVTGG